MEGNLTKIVIRTKDLVSVPQAAQMLNRPKLTLYRWIKSNRMQAIELGGILFVPTKEVERLTKSPLMGALGIDKGGEHTS